MCPFSSLLFALAMEPLAVSNKVNLDIWGIEVAWYQHKVILFADNVLLFFLDPMISLSNVTHIHTECSALSGLCVNKSQVQEYPLYLASFVTSIWLFPTNGTV